jgi:hypothetical protein
MDQMTPLKVVELCKFKTQLPVDTKIDGNLTAAHLPWFKKWWSEVFNVDSRLVRWLKAKFTPTDYEKILAGFTNHNFLELDDVLLLSMEDFEIMVPDLTFGTKTKFKIEVQKYKMQQKTCKILSLPEIENRYDGNKYDFQTFSSWIMSNLQSTIDLNADDVARSIMGISTPFEKEHTSFITKLILQNTTGQAHKHLLQSNQTGALLILEVFSVFGGRSMRDNVDILKQALCNPRTSGLDLNDWIDDNLLALNTYNINVDTIVFSTVLQSIQSLPNQEVLLDKIYTVKDRIDWTVIKSWIKSASEIEDSSSDRIDGADVSFLDNVNATKHMMIDTGSRHHILSNLPSKKQFSPKAVNKFISAYGGSQVNVKGVGEFKLTTGKNPIILSDTLFIPDGQENIFSPLCAFQRSDRYESITLAGKDDKSFIKCKNGTVVPLNFHSNKGWYINMDN